MTDTLTPEKRSWNMSRIRSKNTSPERQVRSLLHRMGFRFRTHKNTLPGKPDIVLKKYRTAVFVHGCFWHRHKGCKDTTTPKSNTAFWKQKFASNIVRDQKHIRELRKSKWKVIVIWECELERPEKIVTRIRKAMIS